MVSKSPVDGLDPIIRVLILLVQDFAPIHSMFDAYLFGSDRRAPGWWFGCHFLFSHLLGMSSSQLTNSYFSEGWPNHQPGDVAWVFVSFTTTWCPIVCFRNCNDLGLWSAYTGPGAEKKNDITGWGKQQRLAPSWSTTWKLHVVRNTTKKHRKTQMGVSQHGGTPKWWVFVRKNHNPNRKWMVTRGTPIAGNLHIVKE